MLTGEYFVLDGALALALPTKFGQFLTVEQSSQPDNLLHWQSLDEKGKIWFSGEFEVPTGRFLHGTDEAIGRKLEEIFHAAQRQNPTFLQQEAGVAVKTNLTFPRNWGLGTSSTLIHNVAQWAGVDAFQLQFDTFGGSGYDIACASASSPILYKKENGIPQHIACAFHPPFADQLYFVYLGKKQNSRLAIQHYRSLVDDLPQLQQDISELTLAVVHAKTLSDFDRLMQQHESYISKILHLNRAKHLYFNDFWGEIKSLGAWGGDFVLVTSDRPEIETRRYFNEKGYDVFFKYAELIL